MFVCSNAYHKNSGRIFVVNAQAKKVDVLTGLNSLNALENSFTDSNLSKDFSIDVSSDYTNAGGINSVAVQGNLLAVAIEHENKQSNGVVAFYRLDAITGEVTHLHNVAVGALPDNVVYSPDGK